MGTGHGHRKRDAARHPLGSPGGSAPVAITVEIRGAERRFFRQSLLVGAAGLTLRVPVALEPEHPVQVAFTLPEDARTWVVSGHMLPDDEAPDAGESGCSVVSFDPLPPDPRRAIARYLQERLGLDPNAAT